MTNFGGVFRTPAARWEERSAGNVVGAGLALSGGGYRAMLMHVGALRRLHEVEALHHLSRVASVSGGSIAAALVARHWTALVGGAGSPKIFEQTVEADARKIASTRIDAGSITGGLVRPRRTVAEQVEKRLTYLFPTETVQGLPVSPEFVFCATNLGTGSLVRFSRDYTADRKVGHRKNLDLSLAKVIAASAAFPPVLSPVRVTLSESDALTEQFGNDEPEFMDSNFARSLELADGGVYDNLGLQPLAKFHTVLVSDGGGPFTAEQSVPRDWLQHMISNWRVTDNQVRSLRRFHLIDSFDAKRRRGTFWGINTKYSDLVAPGVLPVHDGWGPYLSSVPTRLHPFRAKLQQQLINYGYCLADAALRRHFVPGAVLRVARLPYQAQSLAIAPPGEKYDAPKAWQVWKAI